MCWDMLRNPHAIVGAEEDETFGMHPCRINLEDRCTAVACAHFARGLLVRREMHMSLFPFNIPCSKMDGTWRSAVPWFRGTAVLGE